MAARLFLAAALLLRGAEAVGSVGSATVSIVSFTSYLAQPTCVQYCLWHPGAVDDLPPALKCSGPWYDGCLCNSAVERSASLFLQTCVASRCSESTTGPDITSAISVYTEYCASAGSTLPALVTIYSQAVYTTLATCAQQCLWHTGAVDDLMANIACTEPWDNRCLCDASRASSASSFLTSCVASRCNAASTDAQVTQAVAAYGTYCAKAGSPVPSGPTLTGTAATTAATTGAGVGSGTQGSTAMSTTQSAATTGNTAGSNQTGSTSGSGSTSLSTPAIIGIAVGVGIVIIAMAVIIIVLLMKRRKQSPQGGHMPPVVPAPAMPDETKGPWKMAPVPMASELDHHHQTAPSELPYNYVPIREMPGHGAVSELS